MRLLACLLVTSTAALTILRLPSSVQLRRVQRSRKLFAQQSGLWVTCVDPVSGQKYYHNEQTGQSQWEPPHQGYDVQAQWIVAPTDGVLKEYTLRHGQEQILGRFDMVQQNPYVSRAQCLVQVAPDGTASVVSIGKPTTKVLTQGSDAWSRRTVALEKHQTHILRDGDQIALVLDWQRGIVDGLFTVYATYTYGAAQQDRHDEQQGPRYFEFL